MSEPTNDVPQATPEDGQQPAFRVLAQYVKDFSFENPNAPASFKADTQQPKVDVGLDVQAKSLGGDQYESWLTIRVSSKRDEDTIFLCELAYAGVFLVRNLPREQLEPVLMVECPRLLFPVATIIVAQAIRDGGFPPLLLEPVNFADLYQQQVKARAEQAAGEPAAS
ncbi:MAG: protein-export chaperone SecB [Pseudomonadota bacterium]